MLTPQTFPAPNVEMFAIEAKSIMDAAERSRHEHENNRMPELAAGYWCRWCHAFSACPLQRSLAIDVYSGAAAMRFEALMPLADDAAAAKAYEFLKRVKMLSARLSTALYARASERPIPLGDGKWFGKQSKLGTTKIDADIAYKVIRDLHGQEIADAAIERKATQAGIKRGLEYVVGKGPAKGLQDAAMKEIKARGGTSREPTDKIEEYEGEPKLLEAAV